MTAKQAIAEARRRWGKLAMIEKKNHPNVFGETYFVGIVMLGLFFEVRGSSKESWEDAFANSEKHWPTKTKV